MPDYIPSSDADFSGWLLNFLTYANANLATLGLTAADIAPLQAAATAFDTTRATNDSAQAQAQAARQARDDQRTETETLTRALVGELQASATVTDSQRQALGITVRATTRTPVSAPTTKPVATVDTSQRLRHTIQFVDELTPTSRAKPDGVTGCEVWVKVGDPAPADASALKYLATDTRTPYTVDYDGGDAGKTAYYMLRWVNTHGEQGPWSQTVSATIGA